MFFYHQRREEFPHILLHDCWSGLQQETGEIFIQVVFTAQVSTGTAEPLFTNSSFGPKKKNNSYKLYLYNTDTSTKANLRGTIFAYTTVACYFCSARCSRHARIVYNSHDLKLSMATIVVGF